MNNKDIILFILIICVIYLLYCNERKESFTSTSTNVTTTPLPEDITLEDIDTIVSRRIHNLNTERSQASITESIKNLGVLSKRIIDANGDFTFPANLNVTGKFNLLPHGTIVMWGNTTIPNGWVKCDGENNTPDLRGRFVLGEGNKSGDGLTSRTLNQTGGAETHTLTIPEMPSHTHNQHYLGGSNTGSLNTYGEHSDMQVVQGGATTSTGGGQAHNNMPPFWVLIYIMKVY